MNASESSLLDEIQKKLRDLPGTPMEKEMFTMFRVPENIRQKHKELYEPKMVSIGPYYNGHDALQYMEKHKCRFLRDYLSRNPGNTLEHCVSELRGLESQARRCYFEEVKLPPSNQFLMMMLFDGCFIIELILKLCFGVSGWICDVSWAFPIIRIDLLLLENQIPFFVLQKLFDLLTNSDPVSTVPLVGLLSMFISGGKEQQHPIPECVSIKHILHLYHLFYVPTPTSNEPSARRTMPKNRRFPLKLPSATELKESGIIFIGKNTKQFLDIKFQNGILEIPIIPVDDHWKILLLNLVTFEQCNGELNKNLTSYACFMSSILRAPRDVTLLRKEGIVENLQATYEELVLFFNCLIECSGLNYDTHYLKELFTDVNIYYFSDWHRWRATLKINYFSNPWSIISLIAAFALLVLTILQTTYTIIPYYQN
ncbi:UPF0481 protein At3g47200-like [Carex rostrata]